MKKMTITQIRQQIKKHLAVMGKERDKLRDFISDLEYLDENYEEAIDLLERAADCLSEQV